MELYGQLDFRASVMGGRDLVTLDFEQGREAQSGIPAVVYDHHPQLGRLSAFLRLRGSRGTLLLRPGSVVMTPDVWLSPRACRSGPQRYNLALARLFAAP